MKSIVKKLVAYVSLLLSFVTPKSFKRLVLLSTLYAKGGNEKIFTEIDYNTLNDKLNIATDYAAIKSALCLQNLVWKDVDLQEIISTMSCPLNGEFVVDGTDELIDKLLLRLPRWIKYPRAEMVADIRKVLCESPQFATA